MRGPRCASGSETVVSSRSLCRPHPRSRQRRTTSLPASLSPRGRGFLVVVDYAATAAALVTLRQEDWLRTFRAHQHGGPPLADPGEQDITCTVPEEHLVAHAERAGFRLVEHTAQAVWLAALGIDQLADDARGAWRERAAVGDLDAMAARSRVSEAAALTDPSGLGAHRVFVFAKGV